MSQPTIQIQTTHAYDGGLHAHERPQGKSESDKSQVDTEAVGEHAKGKKPIGFFLSLFAIFIIEFLYSLDATILGVAIPATTDDVGGTTLESSWASISYLLAVAIVQPLYSAISDAFGRRAPLYIAYLIFGAGCIIFASAPTMPAVIAGRVLQGLGGGGGVNVLGEIIVADMTTLAELPFYSGLMAIPTSLGSVLGPTVGALFSEYVTWRWIGWLNPPFLGVSLALVVVFLRLRTLASSFARKIRALDRTGMALFTVGIATFAAPLSWADALCPWNSWRTLLPFLSGAAVLALFAAYEARPVAPLMPHRILKNRTASTTLLGSLHPRPDDVSADPLPPAALPSRPAPPAPSPPR